MRATPFRTPICAAAFQHLFNNSFLCIVNITSLSQDLFLLVILEPMNVNCITLLNLFCRLADRPVVPLEAVAPLPLQELRRSCLRSHNDKGKLYSVLSLPTGHSMCNCSLFVAFDVPIWCNILYLGASFEPANFHCL